MRTFSSILPFTNRFGLRRATCLSNGAENGGGGGGNFKSKKSIKETALSILQELRSDKFIRAQHWVDQIVNRGGFARGAVWRVIGQIKANLEEHRVEKVVGRGYRMEKHAQAAENNITPGDIRKVAQEILDQQSDSEFIKLGYWIDEVMQRIDVPEEALSRKQVHSAIYSGFIAAGKVERGSRGTYRKKNIVQDKPGADKGDDGGESAYYEPFAAYLRDTLLECDGAKNVSNIRFGTDSENPDVMGLAVDSEGDPVQYTELVSAEIKKALDIKALMRGFEQACAYTRFSHKVYYLVIPQSMGWWSTNHGTRLTDLCHDLGIGLVVADPDKKPETLPFTILTRARKRNPVLSELNRYLYILRINGGGVRAGRLAEFGFKEDEESETPHEQPTSPSKARKRAKKTAKKRVKKSVRKRAKKRR